MTDHATRDDDRVGVYIDFDNVIISRRDQAARSGVDPNVDIDALLDFASSFGTLTTSRAYADWSRKETQGYRERLLSRAVDTIQMFTTSGKIKNAADIRLSIDVIEDMFLLPDLTHIVIVAGDSDYIPLAQRAKRMGRYVVGIGVAGSTSRLLAAACDEFYDYDELPGLHTDGDGDEDEADGESRSDERARRGSHEPGAEARTKGGRDEKSRRADRRAESTGERPPVSTADQSDQDDHHQVGSEPVADEPTDDFEDSPSAEPVSKRRATQLLLRALEYSQSKTEEDWHDAGAVKRQILRMEPGFQEAALGFDTFSEFLRSRGGLVEIDERKAGQRRVRLRR